MHHFVPLAHCRLIVVLSVLSLGTGPALARRPPLAPLDPARVRALADALPAQPVGLGRPATDRAAWAGLAKRIDAKKVVAAAEKALAQPLPQPTDELFLDYSRTGNRSRYQRVWSDLLRRTRMLALAECFEHRRRFVAKLEQAIARICKMRTWVLPAHDGGLNNFHGRGHFIDLSSSALAWQLALTDAWLADELSPGTRKLLADNLRRRIIDPTLAIIAGKASPYWWMTADMNWSAVCWSGVVGAVLTSDPDRHERALVVAAAARNIQRYLDGFTADGYCSEGLGYWNYGFGHFMLLGDSLLRATGGKVDLFASPHVATVARFGRRIEVIHGVAPAYADCSVNTRPADYLVALIDHHFFNKPPATVSERWSLAYLAASAWPYRYPAPPDRRPDRHDSPRRTWFDTAQVLICRPAEGVAGHFGAAIKGGHNNEHHNHNDVGSFIVVVDDTPVLVDPGPEVYTARTFSSRRYVSKVLNSFGHDVPRVAGQLQRTGRAAAATVLAADFTDERDTLRLDLKAAYAVASLKQLTRTFLYDRRGAGFVQITDTVALTGPQAFGTALITFGRCRVVDPTTLRITDHGKTVLVKIRTNAGPLNITQETLDEDVHGPTKPTRIGLDCRKPVTGATITLTITPQ